MTREIPMNISENHSGRYTQFAVMSFNATNSNMENTLYFRYSNFPAYWPAENTWIAIPLLQIYSS